MRQHESAKEETHHVLVRQCLFRESLWDSPYSSGRLGLLRTYLFQFALDPGAFQQVIQVGCSGDMSGSCSSEDECFSLATNLELPSTAGPLVR